MLRLALKEFKILFFDEYMTTIRSGVGLQVSIISEID